MKFGKCEIALHEETTFGLQTGLATKSLQGSTKRKEHTMKTQTGDKQKKRDKFTWKVLLALTCMVPLVRRATWSLTGMTSLRM